MALLVAIVAIAGVVVLTAPESTRVVLFKVVYTDVSQASSALRQLVSENTQ